MARGRAQDGDEHRQPQGGAHLLGDVDQTRCRPRISGFDPGEPRLRQGHQRGPRADAQEDEADEDLQVRRPGMQLLDMSRRPR